MKTIIFRPLRRIKKTGKITVASYAQWRKVLTSDYNKFNLIVMDDFKCLPKDEHVYNHNGDLIFFFTYNPADIPVFNAKAENIIDEHWLDKLHATKKPHGIKWEIEEGHINYNCKGMDCDGVPTFSHWTEDRITQEDTWNYFGPEQFEPLTVGKVTQWIGWFLWQLNNSYLKIGKDA